MADDCGQDASPGAARPCTKSRNIQVGKRRTSARLEPEIREALKDICEREGMAQAELCALIESRKRPDRTMSSALRTFAVAYFRNAARKG